MRFFRNISAITPIRRLQTLAVVTLSFSMAACGGGGSDGSSAGGNFPGLALGVLVQSACSLGDSPETGLQGQIPMAERLLGFKGFNCNLQRVSATQSRHGERIFSQTAIMRDASGRLCVYGGGAMEEFGTIVMDMTDPSAPVETAYLSTPAMMNPGEGLKVNEARGLLVSARYTNSPSSPLAGGLLSPGAQSTDLNGFDIYDVKTDCRYPQLLATTKAIAFSTAGLRSKNGSNPWPDPDFLYGHEGNFAPDGLTYYVADFPHQVVHAIDLADPTSPRLIGTYDFNYAVAPHGMTVTSDGNRAYFTQQAGSPVGQPPTSGEYHNGFSIIDTSEIQARVPGGRMKFISEVINREGSWQQLAIEAKIKGKPYVIALGEAGPGLFGLACAAGVNPFSAVRIYNIADERNPVLASDIRLEVNDPKNCATVAPEMALPRVLPLVYDVHHCTVDNREHATTLACGYFESGIRVYDIRDPENVREIAYFNPASKPGRPGTGWCASLPFLDAEKGMLYSFCQDAGVLALRFSNGVWPLPGTTTPKGKQL